MVYIHYKYFVDTNSNEKQCFAIHFQYICASIKNIFINKYEEHTWSI